MSGRRAIFGLCAFCALLLSALAAQSASALAPAGTTAFTCKPESGGAGFSDAHCKTAVSTGATFKHVAITQGEETEIKATNETTGGLTETTKFKSTFGGSAATLESTALIGEGTLINKLDEEKSPKEHYAHATGRIHYTNVTVNKPNCKVFEDGNGVKGTEGTVTTKELTGTTTGKGDAVTIRGEEQADGQFLFARFIIEGCTNAAINGTYSVYGSITAVPTGATLHTTHNEVTTQNGLYVNSTSVPAGLEGTLTIKGRKKGGTEETTPITTTTVET